ncbi:MAG: lysophospholipid acyltransferase family protein [Gammaproteobacteria bacterium]|nr:lysophospholipid acyltransferase family protein [Gammaproteobacteria bacterium]
MNSSLRACAFYLGYASFTVGWGAISILVAWLLPYRTRFHFIISTWTNFSLFWLRLTCGVGFRIIGAEHIPEHPCVVLVRHESTWEVAFLQTLFAPKVTLVKRELLWIPFFGWAFALLKPIAIDRGNPRKALRKLIHEGRRRLDQNVWVVLFPEGTRMPVDEIGKFQVGGAALASATGVPLLIVAHDSGRFWPPHQLSKLAGSVTVNIAPTIDPRGKTTKEINALAATTMATLMAEIANPSGSIT